MRTDAIAVIIPVFNGSRYLPAAIASVQRQSLPPSSIIIVDDCSTDDTRACAERLARDDSRIRVLGTARNAGAGDARNVGVASVEEPLVAMLDADDEWLPHHLATLAAVFRSNPDTDVAFSHAT